MKYQLLAIPLLSLMLLGGCAVTVSTPANNNERTISMADHAFDELDNGVSVEDIGRSKAVNSNQQTVAKADKAFDELDGKPTVAEKPKPSSAVVEEKARPSSLNVEEKARPTTAEDVKQDFAMKNGYPVWVLEPQQVAGYRYVAVGSAKLVDNNKTARYQAASSQARAEISRMISVQVDNEIKTERQVNQMNGNDKMTQSIETYSRQRSESLQGKIETIYTWEDMKTGELYMLMGLKN